MNIEAYRDYCLSLKGVTESFPFDETTLVFKVMGKMFSLLNTKAEHSVNLKFLPDKCLHIREQYPVVKAGYHMNKKHWNTIPFDPSIEDQKIREWTKESYNLIVSGLTKKLKAELERF